MIPCLPEHIGEVECPECGENHKEFGLLPENAITPTDLGTISELDSIHGLFPAVAVHGEDGDGYYQKEIVVLVVITGRTVQVVYWDDEDRRWIQVRGETVNYPVDLATEFLNAIQESASRESEFLGREAIPMYELPDPVIPE
jgi:hypothetical protein